MLNRDVFAIDPEKYTLANEGVAKLTFPPDTPASWARLKGELQTFVCDGAYAEGLVRILDRFNAAHAGGADIPGVWISGFFGSGKSHLASMLAALWDNLTFSDRATAEGLIPELPGSVRAPLLELRNACRRAGGALAVGGTMGHGSSDPATAVAELVLRGVGLPSNTRAAEVALWMASEGILQGVKARLDGDFEDEVRTFVLSDRLHRAILAEKPSVAPDATALASRLESTFPARAADALSVDEMEKLVRRALMLDRSELPLTVIVLDELQQFLGQNQDLTLKVQNIAERLSCSFGGRVLLVATGQQALTDLPYLQKLFDRFPVTVSLREADIDTVIRRTVLRKKPEAAGALQAMLDRASGEIHRQLQGAKLKHLAADDADAPLDWPFLPARRRLLERILRELDRTNLRGSLRGQLRTTLGTARRYAERPLGTAVAFDAIYEELSDDLLRSGLIPAETREMIEKLRAGDAVAHLKARVLMTVFLLSRIDSTADIHGVRARAEIIADLLIEDLEGDHTLRGRVPEILQELSDEGAIIEVGGDWRPQTRESAEWDRAFRHELQVQGQDPTGTVRARRDLVSELLAAELRDATGIQQGAARVERRIVRISPEDPAPDDQIFVRVYSGFEANVDAARKAIVAEAPASPAIHLLIPNHRQAEINQALKERAAADAVLAGRGVPQSEEGKEARAALQQRRDKAEALARELVKEAVAKGEVLLAGGASVTGETPALALRAAAERAIERLYPRFREADNAHWGKAVARAKEKQPDALKAVDYNGPPEAHAVAKELLGIVGSGRKGSDLRAKLMAPPYGWPQDAIDAMLLILSRDHLRVTGPDGQPASLDQVQQNRFGSYNFTRETRALTSAERLRIRQLLKAAGIGFEDNREGDAVIQLLSVLEQAASAAGGESPAPATAEVPGLAEVRGSTGNDRLGAVADRAEAWKSALPTWKAQATEIEKRLPKWRLLQRLIDLGAKGVGEAAEAIATNRALLADPDPVPPLIANAAADLRTRANDAYAGWKKSWDQAEAALQADANWAKLSPEDKHVIREDNRLLPLDPPKLDTPEAVAASLESCSLERWSSEASACRQRVEDALAEAALKLEPKTQRVTIARRTITTEADLDAWLADVRAGVAAKLADGPVQPQF